MDEIDPKAFIAKTHRQVASRREVELAFQYAGFEDVELVSVPMGRDPDWEIYWVLYATASGDEAKVKPAATALLGELGVYPIEIAGNDAGVDSTFWTVRIKISSEQISRNDEVAECVVDALLEDIDADLPSHKSEVRILPTNDPRRFDVTLLTGFYPVYIGTLGHQGSLWKPVEVMPGVGRELRAKLHFVGPNKEDVAMAMVQTLRPIWKRKIAGHMTDQMESDEEVDPKAFVKRKKIAFNIPRLRDLKQYPDDQVFVCSDPVLMQQYGFTEPFRCDHVYWKGGGVVSIEFNLQNSGYGLPLSKNDFAQAKFLEPVMEDLANDIAKEADKVEKPASPEQAEAGNYRKGHVNFQGLEIAIENAKGSTRSGKNKNGTPWKVTMPAHYGYIKGTQGKDKDHLDVYIGTKPDGIMAYVVNQRTFEGAFDEHKIMLGYHSKDDAIADYDAAFSGNLGPRLRASVVSTTVDKLKEWITSGDTKKPFDGIVESLLEDGPEVEISPITEADLPEVKRILLAEFGRFGDWAWGTIERDTDWSMSRKAVVNGQIVGAYAIGSRQLKDGLAAEPQDKIKLYEDVSRYAAMRGVEGVALASAQEVRGSGVGRALKDSVHMIDADYIWGSQLKALNNIQQWLRRRVLVAETDDTYFNVEVLNGANAAVESLLEADEEYGFDALKNLAFRASQGAAPGTEFTIGFAVSTFDQHMIEARANDDAIEVDWEAVNAAIPIIERNAMAALNEQGIRCRSEGHDGQDDLVGTAWIKTGTDGMRIVQQFIDAGEPFRTSSGTIDSIQKGLALRLYQGVPDSIAALIEVDISFFDLDAVNDPDPLAESDDVKSLAMRVPRPPQNESDEIDPKAFLGAHEQPVTLTPQYDNAWWVERKEDNYPLGQLFFDLHDDAPTPEARANWADMNWIAIPLTPSVQPQAFKDQDEAIQFLLQHGNR